VADTTQEKQAKAARQKASRLRDKTFEMSLKTPKKDRLPIPPAFQDEDDDKPEGTARLFFGIFQNCGRYYTAASTWYEAASDAYESGNYALGNSYKAKGDASFAQGDDCMSFW
jgi:hypothetical protein